MKTRVLVILFLGTAVMAVFSVIGNLVASQIWESGLTKPFGTWISVAFIGLAFVLFAISVWQFRAQSVTPPEAASLDVARQFLQFLKKSAQGVGETSPSATVTPARAGSVGQDDVSTPFSQDPASLRSVLADVGLTKWTTALSNSGYEPLECMKLARRSLDFMGIAGSKWVAEVVVRNEFEEFLTRIRNRGGRVRFLMIDPQSDAFRTLRTMRGGALHAEPFAAWRKLLRKYECLEVRLYADLPCFRLAFIDGTEVAVARYRINRDGYFQSKFGWEAPHLVFSSSAKWSFYDPFEAYFRQVWDRSRDLRGDIKQ